MLWPNMNWPSMLLKKSARVKDCVIVHRVNFGAPMERSRDGSADAVMLHFSDRP